MSNSTEQVPLPFSVESLIECICREQNQPHPDSTVRQKLADIGEQRALLILSKISKSKIQKSLSAYILYMISSSSSSSSSSSPFSSPSKPPFALPLFPNGSPASATHRLSPHQAAEYTRMSNSTEQVPLPFSVETLIDCICQDQNQPPPDSTVRQKLADIGEQKALLILYKISKSKIQKSLSAYILHMIGSSSSSSSSSSSPFSSPSKPPFALPLFPNGSPASATHRRLSPHPGTVSLGTPHSPVAELQRNPSHFYAERGEEKMFSSELVALGELEFRKAFLLLSYIGGESLEKAIGAEQIRSLKDLPMGTFEKEIWEAVGKKYISCQRDRQLYLDWDSGRPYVYHCYVSPDGSLRFKGPILHNTRTHLQKSLGDDNVLVVKFSEERNGRNLRTSAQEANDLYGKFGKEGIRVGLRLYRFFVFKDGGKEEKKKDPTTSSVKCYFVRMVSDSSADKRAFYILSNKTMFEARSLFMHAHKLASLGKYMARFSLILSKTFTLKIDLANVKVQKIEDVYCQDEDGNIVYDNDGKPRIHTDGTGFISEDLAACCPSNVSEGRPLKNKNMKGIPSLVALEDMIKATGEGGHRTLKPPLLIQCRLFHMGQAIKGTLLVNKKLPPRTIQVRPSMIKVGTDPDLLNIPSINSMEVVQTSNHPNRTYLSKNLIALLSYGGVPNDFFMDVLRSNLEDADQVFSNKRAALRAAVNHGEMDDYNAAGMILCGIPLDEPHLQHHLSILAKEEKKRLRGGKLYVSDCFYLMGTVDPTGCLERNQVCIIHDNGQITGDVLVYRNPGLHFGDIHVMRARYVEEIESYVGHSKYAIFFPCVGPRSVADEIGGGDFDGDMYWVSKNPQLLKYFRKSDPWIENQPCNSVSLDSTVKSPSEEELFGLYLKTRFEPSNAISVAADSWMALMDRLLTLRNDCTIEREKEQVKENILKLIDMYYAALDAPKKTGTKIHVPNNLAVESFPHYMERDKSFTSTFVLGLIYDEVGRWQLNEDIEIRKLPCFDIEIPTSCMKKWDALYKDYRKDMTIACSNAKDEAAEVFEIYKQKLYGADKMEDSPKDINDIYNEALAVYHITYDYAIQINEVGRCGFAWKVAGSALTSLYTIKQNQRALTCAPSILREIFGS